MLSLKNLKLTVKITPLESGMKTVRKVSGLIQIMKVTKIISENGVFCFYGETDKLLRY